MTDLDSKDIQLLALLQQDSQVSAIEMSEKLGMSASQIGRRRQKLEAEGYINGYPCRLNAEKLGLSVQAFIQVETESQTNQTHAAIKQLTHSLPEIVAAWTLTGEADYIFRVYCKNLAGLNYVMDQVKDETALPLNGIRTAAV